MRVLIACGGTGGHVFPGVAIAEGLRGRGHDVALILSQKKIDEIVMREHRQIPVFTLPAVGSPALLSPRIVLFLLRFISSIWKARAIIREYAPDVILGMGGFTSMPPLVVGRKMGIPTLLHDANAIPGRANRLGVRFATTVLVGWEAATTYLRHRNIRVVGTPIRGNLRVEQAEPETSGALFGLNPAKPVLLVIGGSQGARGLNRLVVDALPALARAVPDLQLLHLSGELDFAEVEAGYRGCSLAYHVAPFWHEMGQIYAITDLVVARSGASTLNELAVLGIPAVLIPYPYAADDHQRANARIFADAGAALLADEATTTPEGLADMVGEIWGDQSAFRRMSEAMQALAPERATELICDAIESAAVDRQR